MSAEQRRLAFFVTCLVDQIMPEIGVASVRLLRQAGYEPEFPGRQTCCGQPFLNSGFREQAMRLARHTIEILEPFDYVVLPSGSCTAMLRVHYPHLFRDDPVWERRAQQLAAKTYELTEFLIHVAHWQPFVEGKPLTVTYHDSCHMARMLHLHDEPRFLLSTAGALIHEMQEPDRCCGFGGVFSVRVPEVSNAITADKLREAVDTQTSMLVTADPGCLMQMRGMVDDLPIQVEHIAVVFGEIAGTNG
jgi:Fe-S oxidoreductase